MPGNLLYSPLKELSATYKDSRISSVEVETGEVWLKDEALYNELDEASLESVWLPDPQFAFLYNGLQERDMLHTKIFFVRFVFRCIFPSVPARPKLLIIRFSTFQG